LWFPTEQINYWSDVIHSSDREERGEYNETVHQPFRDFKRAYDSVMRGVLYDIVIEFGLPMKLLVLFKRC
jgi:hypothetical protein